MPLLSAESLSCGYGKHPVLRDVSLAVEAGTCLAVLGPNGSGKSTLLKTLCGGLAPLAGRVLWQETPLTGYSAVQLAHRIAFVPQGTKPAFDFRVEDVVLMGRLPYASGFSESSEDTDAANEAMVTMDCQQFAERPLSTLSGGEQQRVWIARALAQSPECILFDEPTTHLDLAHQVELIHQVRRLKSLGYGIIAAIHDLNWANEVAESAVVLGEGQVTFYGKMPSLLTENELSRAFGIPFTKTTGPNVGDRWFPLMK